MNIRFPSEGAIREFSRYIRGALSTSLSQPVRQAPEVTIEQLFKPLVRGLGIIDFNSPSPSEKEGLRAILKLLDQYLNMPVHGANA